MKTVKNTVASLLLLTLAAPALATEPTNPMDAIFAAVDLTTIEGFVSTVGVTVIGIALAFKGIALAKRGISRA
jgi:hypothetical protein